MRLRWMVTVTVVLSIPVAVSAQVRSAAVARIKLLNKKAMDEYDGLEFETARKLLVDAINVARAAGINRGPSLVTTYLNLGIVFGAGLNDRLNAIKYFGQALRLDSAAALDPARSTPVLEDMFKAAKDSLPPPRQPPGSSSFRHTPPHQGTVGRPIQLHVRVSPELGARKVVLFLWSSSAGGYLTLAMDEERPGQFTVVIPADKIVGRTLRYYIEARDEAGQRAAGSGTAESPNIVPLRERGGSVPAPSTGRERFSFSVSVGTGVGIVAGGKSEHTHPYSYMDANYVEVGPGVALAPLHVAPELSYHVTDHWELAGMCRIQFVNATTEKGSVSVLGLARAKYHLGTGPLRGLLSFGGGGGQVRHRIPLGDYDGSGLDPSLDTTPNDVVDTRVAGLGALVLGAGLRYMFTTHVGFIAELNLLFLVPQFAANADINTGLIFSF